MKFHTVGEVFDKTEEDQLVVMGIGSRSRTDPGADCCDFLYTTESAGAEIDRHQNEKILYFEWL